jgi:hypothetical protein
MRRRKASDGEITKTPRWLLPYRIGCFKRQVTPRLFQCVRRGDGTGQARSGEVDQKSRSALGSVDRTEQDV